MRDEAGTEVAKTDANEIRRHLEALTKTAHAIREKTQEITLRATVDEKAKEAEGEKPSTFVNEVKDSLKHIGFNLDEALAALRAFI